jgi:hypothetical protein
MTPRGRILTAMSHQRPKGTPGDGWFHDEVRREVAGLIASCGCDGGRVVAPSNMIQPDTSVENILALFEATCGAALAASEEAP